jgi:hypothetical protein
MKNPQTLRRAGLWNVVLVLMPTASSGGCSLSFWKPCLSPKLHGLDSTQLKRDVVKCIVSHYSLKLRRACTLIQQTRSTQYYQSVKDPKTALRRRMHEIAHTRVRYGYRRIHVLLKREGWQLGKNQAFRLYKGNSCN